MEDLPWIAEPLARTLARYQQGRLPHALLIRANEGWGEVNLANRLALGMLERSEVADARLLAHPDLKWLQPEGSVIKVDQVRELAAFAVGTRQSAACKVAVVESAELMNTNAANALLKTLEEPPPDTYLLLTSSRPARLLPTIISRCQTVTIERDAAAAKRWLLTHWSTDEIEDKLFECGEAPMAVHEALGSTEPALAPLLSELVLRSPVSALIQGMLAWDIDRLTSGWYRHCLALLAGQSRLSGIDLNDRASLGTFVDELKSVRYQLLMTNSANQRLLYERLVVKWRALFTAAGRKRQENSV